MEIRVATMRYSEGLQGFPEDALRRICAGHEVLDVSEHSVLHGNVSHLMLNVKHGDVDLSDGGIWRELSYESSDLEDSLPVERFEASVRSLDGGARWFGFRNVLRSRNVDLILATEERAASGSNRVNRGGSWNNDAGNCTSSYRNNWNPSNTNNNLGFRLFSTRNGSMSNSVQPAPDMFGTNNAEAMPASKRDHPPTAGVRPFTLENQI